MGRRDKTKFEKWLLLSHDQKKSGIKGYHVGGKGKWL